ncbi:effector-associated constant component EACC1 [Uniformispora flossi]|uniref:effector-associated constant component EACC1 n=1 Tax=Uniformispora flossi TaxID=3390723 RepID=UPI003C2AE973
MSTEAGNRTAPTVSVTLLDDDPLRARREARELLAELSPLDPTAELRLPTPGGASGADKGIEVVDAVGLTLSAGSFVAACLQVWLAKAPQRTVVVTRPDGAVLRINGREAREDDDRVARFLAGDPPPAPDAAAGSTAAAG